MRPCVLIGVGLMAFGGGAPAWAAEFFVDPVRGDASGDGSAEHPWATIQQVVEDGLIETQEWAELPYADGAELVVKNAGAPVRAGDTVWLRSGYHGELTIESAYNAQNITLAAEPGHSPQLSRLLIRASSHWRLVGLEVSAELAPNYESGTLVTLESHSWSGPVHHVTVEDCTLSSVSDASAWTADEWDQLSCTGFQVSGSNMTIRGNRLANVNFGISVSATDSLIEWNVVDGFAGDGLRGLGDRTTFQYNTVKNCYAVNDNHDDGFQSWSVGSDEAVGTGEVTGIVLRGNLILNYEDPDQPHRGTLQGIGCFDGMFVDWVVENNVIITDHWHGITLSGARNCRIVNNTVMDLNDVDPGPPWIRIGGHKDGRSSTDCVVRNNLSTAFNHDGTVTEDHNLVIEDPTALFVDPAGFDLRLLPTAAAVDMGNSELAPRFDIEGVPRPQGQAVDVGAYEYHADDVVPFEGAAGMASHLATGGAAGTAATEADAGSGPGSPTDGAVPEAKDEGGCGCRIAAPVRPPHLTLWWVLAALACGALRGRRTAAARRPPADPSGK